MSNNSIQNHKRGGEGVRAPDAIVHDIVYAEFVKFMSLPNPEKCEMLGIPFDEGKKRFAYAPTLERFAQKFGVHRNTLGAWKKREGFDIACRTIGLDWGKGKTPDVLAALYRRCVTHGNAYDVELWLAFFEGWDRKQVVKVIGDSFTGEDIRALIAKLPTEQQDDMYVKLGELITLTELGRDNG